jgi:hypothetical protein
MMPSTIVIHVTMCLSSSSSLTSGTKEAWVMAKEGRIWQIEISVEE